jgi:hypothetical protein
VALGSPLLLVVAVAQAPPGSPRGLALAVGWVGLACALDLPRRRRSR